MHRQAGAIPVFLLIAIMLAACGPPTATVPANSTSQPAIPNPASQFCEANGGVTDIRSDADGTQTALCLFVDGGECEEWAYFRGGCQAGSPPPSPSSTPASQSPVAGGPISLQLLLPEDGSQLTAPQCQVVGTTAPGAVVSVYEEIVIADGGGAFQVTITLEPGPNLIEVVASTAAGSEAFAYVTVTYEP